MLPALQAVPTTGSEETPFAAFWNLENFFDYRDSSGTDNRRMSKGSFFHKRDLTAKTILYFGAPAIVGVAEIENAYVLHSLTSSPTLHKLGYKVIHYESGDRRGIDTGMLYRPDKVTLLCSGKRTPTRPDGSPMSTRDLLWAGFAAGQDTVAVIVCHLPSKFSGEKRSRPARDAATASLKSLADSLIASLTQNIIVMGDFNDTPSSECFLQLSPTLENLAAPLEKPGTGTICFQGTWELIDQIWVTPQVAGRMEIVKPPFLMERDSKHGGMRPRRAYRGPTYIGGVSDHLPIVLKISSSTVSLSRITPSCSK